LSRKTKVGTKASKETPEAPAAEAAMGSSVGSDKPNGVHDGNVAEASSEDACCGPPVQPINTPEVKVQRELKPPKVLEVLIFNLVIWSLI